MSMRSLRERAARFGGANTIRNVIAEDERAGEVIHRLRGMHHFDQHRNDQRRRRRGENL